MGSVKKIGNEYIIEFYARGLQYQQKAGADKTKAESLLKSIEEKIAKGEMALIVRDVDYDVFFHDFLENTQTAYPKKTAKRFEAAIRDFEEFLKSNCMHVSKLSEMTPHVGEQYSSFLTKKTQAVNLTLFLLRQVFEYAIKLGYLNDNPLLHIRFMKENAADKSLVVTPEEIQLLVKKSSEKLALIIEFILLTGLHVCELCALNWDDIDLEHRLIKIKFKGKLVSGFTDREIPLQQRAFKILEKLKNYGQDSAVIFTDALGKKLNFSKLEDELKKTVKECHLKKEISFLHFRHTFALELIKRGATLFSLQKILGHEDIADTLLYAPFIFENSMGNAYRTK